MWNPLDRLASGIAAVLEVPLVVISVFEGGRQVFVGAHGLVGHGPAEHESHEPTPMCRQVMDCGRPSLVQDVRRRFPRTSAQQWGGFDVAGYAGIPLMVEDGSCIGTLAAFDRVHRTWRARDLVILRAFADAAAALVDRTRIDRERAALAQLDIEPLADVQRDTRRDVRYRE